MVGYEAILFVRGPRGSARNELRKLLECLRIKRKDGTLVKKCCEDEDDSCKAVEKSVEELLEIGKGSGMTDDQLRKSIDTEFPGEGMLRSFLRRRRLFQAVHTRLPP